MNRTLPFLLLALLASGCGTTSPQTLFLTNPTASTTPTDVVAYETQYAGYDGAWLDFDMSYEHTFSSNSMAGGFEAWHLHQIVKRRYVVLNPEAEWLSTFSLEIEQGENLAELYLFMIPPDGPPTMFDISDMKVERDSDGTRRFKFAYPEVVKGTVIEEGFQITYNMLENLESYYTIPLQFEIPAERVRFRYVYPEEWEIEAKRLGVARPPLHWIAVDPVSLKNVLTYEAEDVPALQDEIYSPFFKEVANYLEFRLSKIGNGQATVEIVPDTWSDIADALKAGVLDRRAFLDNTPKQAARQATKDAVTDMEKLRAVLDYVQANVEVDSGSKSRTFKDAIKNRSANFLLMTSLTFAMLREAKLDAQFIVVHEADDGFFDPSFVAIQQLYTPAIRVEIEDEDYIVFPYLKYLQMGHIPESYLGQDAMLISRDGYEGMIRLPTENRIDNVAEENYTLTIDEEGVIHVEEEKVLRGSQAFAVRTALAEIEEEEDRREVVEELLTYTDGDVTLETYAFENEDLLRLPLRIKLTYTIDNLVTITPDEILFQTGGLFSPLSRTKTKVVTADRQTPIRIYYDEEERKRVTIRMPESWTLATPLEPVSFENQFGSLSAQYEAAPGELRVEQSVKLVQAEAPAEDFSKLLDLIGSRSSSLEIPTLVFSVNLDEGD